MVLKPIPLSAFTPTFIPPVTGVGGSSAPIANSFDSSGLFPYRSRSSSANKRRRGEEIDLVFDRSEAYPPLHPPAKPSLNIPVIRELVVAATAAGGVGQHWPFVQHEVCKRNAQPAPATESRRKVATFGASLVTVTLKL